MSTPIPDIIDGAVEETYLALDVLARSLQVRNAELQPTLDAIVTSAVDTIAGADHAGLILMVRGELVPQSTVGRPPLVLDLLQQKLGRGPCIDAAQSQMANVIEDARGDDRWPQFAAEAVRLGVLSVLCVPLCANEKRLGSLSLYAETASAFNDHDQRVTALFATLSAVALDGATRQEQMQAALANRDVIGQAKGILMERHRLTADAAFGRLAHASQSQNRKLIDIAADLVATGELVDGQS